MNCTINIGMVKVYISNMYRSAPSKQLALKRHSSLMNSLKSLVIWPLFHSIL